MLNFLRSNLLSLSWVTWLFFTLLLSFGDLPSPSADQAQYFYDELGR